MSATITTAARPARDDLTTAPVEQPQPAAAGRGWAFAGVGAAVASIVAGIGAGTVDAVYDESVAGDADAVMARLADQVPNMVAFHVAGTVAALLLPVFALGLHRRLRSAGDGMLAAMAAFGLLATSVVMVLATALNTEFLVGLATDAEMLPESAAVYNHWIGTVAGCWVLVGLSALAVFAASRRGAVARWLGITGLVLGGLTLLVGVAPVQYMAGLTGSVWLLVTGLGFALGDRVHRTGR